MEKTKEFIFGYAYLVYGNKGHFFWAHTSGLDIFGHRGSLWVIAL